MELNRYQLWYLANGSRSAKDAHDLIALKKAHISHNYIESKFTTTQLAEGLLNLMDFDKQAIDHLSMMNGSYNAEVSKVHSSEIDHVHSAMGDVIRSEWKNTPTEEEIAQEIAANDALAYIDDEMEKLCEELEHMNMILGKR